MNHQNRRQFMHKSSAIVLGATASSAKAHAPNNASEGASIQRTDEPANSNYRNNRAPLRPNPYIQLPIGAIKPKGWLRQQLRTMAQGMTGNLDARYQHVLGPRNGWLGGDGDGWERGPYWLDGLLPLAYILDDQELIAKTRPWVEWSLNNQREDGYFGPIPFDEEPEHEPGMQKVPRRDWWPKMVMLKVLKQYYMATGDERVIALMTNYFRFQLNQLPDYPLGHWTFWGNRRGGDNMMIVYWLYNITGDEFLLELADLLFEQTHNWTELFSNDHLSRLKAFHCVNFAQGLKQPVIYYQHHPEEKYAEAVKQALRDIQKYHGQPQGMYGGDELLHGKDPTQGSEFCSAVELMYSLENILMITGDTQYADHLERVAYNALPTQINDDFTYRQYYQQPNQVLITYQYRNFFTEHGGDLCYGLLTGYPCCTCNLHQGWPKFTQHLWLATNDGGLGALLYAPCEVTAKVAEGVEVHIQEDTFYPFEEAIRFTISPERAVEFPLHVRIPGWCREPSLAINGQSQESPKAGEIAVISRRWEKGDEVRISLPMRIQISRWHHHAAVVERGPLVYALKIRNDWRLVDDTEKGKEYYEVRPKDPWNYGILEEALRHPDEGFKVWQAAEPTDKPWSLENAPLQIITEGKRIPDWKLYNGSAGPVPASPRYHVGGEVVELELVPYGCTTLRITEFPTVL